MYDQQIKRGKILKTCSPEGRGATEKGSDGWGAGSGGRSNPSSPAPRHRSRASCSRIPPWPMSSRRRRTWASPPSGTPQRRPCRRPSPGPAALTARSGWWRGTLPSPCKPTRPPPGPCPCGQDRTRRGRPRGCCRSRWHDCRAGSGVAGCTGAAPWIDPTEKYSALWRRCQRWTLQLQLLRPWIPVYALPCIPSSRSNLTIDVHQSTKMKKKNHSIGRIQWASLRPVDVIQERKTEIRAQ